MGGKSSEATAILPGPVHICGRVVILVILFALIAVPCLIFYNDAYPLQFSRLSCHSDPSDSSPTPSNNEQMKLERVLKAATMKDNTVILTTLNEAWAAPNSILDLFLESFKTGENTKHLLTHLVIIALDQKAYERCLQLHPHCYALNVEGVDFTVEAYFMSEDYLKMVWSKIDIQRSVLEMGYNFLFTDADIVWFKEPFNRFYEDTDLQISCDNYLLNDSYSLANNPNSGFKYVKSNNRTKQFYKYWYDSRIRYPNQHDQAVLVKLIKLSDPFIKEIALKIRFLSTLYFGGLCEPSKDMNQVCTMHANCCFGLESKIHDLNLVLDDWRHYKSLSLSDKSSYKPTWRSQDCRKKFDYHHIPKKMEHERKKD
ncbi:hypothetical protein C5167_025503 [Papaver somniferum]|uniref:Nucleotide-diphospho-sugar transferase domain-containing protein n=1 Tax=Papaver somniferum TaxID=3469 RepID=A0A4Y7JSN3_PAPSO|nr:uncharacterized protein At4g15970-like [Papaver somniferum]RZC63727.1 hypothetical protein C5167_025503 [Papaver somniferum]